MPKVELKIRDLRNGDVMIAECGSVEDACTWLRDRPEMVEVLGVPTPYLSREDHTAMREAARPLGDDERAAARALDEADAAAERAREEELARQDAAELEAYREAQRTADPNRPMEVRWSLADGFALQDPYDPREIPEAVRDVASAWIRERDGWVADRGQVVAEALLTITPGPTPTIHPGAQFWPASRGQDRPS